MSSSAITLNNVSKVYSNGLIALQQVSLEIAKSEFVSIVGSSGCGKSTLLRLIASLSHCSSGSVVLRKDVIQTRQDDHIDYPIQKFQSLAPTVSSLHELAFVFQDAALMPWATVLENISLPLKLAKVSKRVAAIKIKRALALVGLVGFEKAYPRELSGGMKMRISLARALVTDPVILLMDEPFSALDEITRTQLNRDLLRLWREKQWTVVFVTHNIYEAVYLSERVIVMSSRPGRIVADIKIDAPYPRSEEFRTSELHGKYCREVLCYLSNFESS